MQHSRFFLSEPLLERLGSYCGIKEQAYLIRVRSIDLGEHEQNEPAGLQMAQVVVEVHVGKRLLAHVGAGSL